MTDEAGDLLFSRGSSRRHILRTALQAPYGPRCDFCSVAPIQRNASQGSKLPGRAYADGRPNATLRLDAIDHGPIIRHGSGPAQCDYLGAREAICFRSGDTYYLHYDGAGPSGWRACLAVSHDLRHWELKGPILDLGEPGTDDAGTASSPWTIFDGKLWHMFTLDVGQPLPHPIAFPAVPYFTLAAKSLHPYFEPSNRTWFLFTNHIGLDEDGEYTVSIWVYWSNDLNRWEPEQRAVVLDQSNCKWSKRCIGMPSVVQVGKRLALFDDNERQHGTRRWNGLVEFAFEYSALTSIGLPFGVAPFALASQCVVLAIL
jgi:hypothetical protein